MASNLRVDSIVPATGSSVSIGTATGGVNIPGVLTYEDVTNVDSVGVITARSGVNVSGGEVKVGTAVTVSSGGVITSGIVTATNVSAASSVTAATFHGSGANLTSLPASGLFSSYAIIADQKSSGTDAGSSTGGQWHTRDLNTELSDPDGIVSISSNQFTLQSGSYFLEASAPSYQPSRHKLKLYQTSGSAADVAFGGNEFLNSSVAVQNRASLSCRITISTATTYEIRHYIQSSKSGNGLGVAVSQGDELYCIVKIFKES